MAPPDVTATVARSLALVNAGFACNHVRVRRLPMLATLVVVSLALGACGRDGGRELARYYDERGLFTVDLPAENDIVVTPPSRLRTVPDC